MIDAGGLSNKPAEFAAEHNRRWLVSSFEAGDVVLHDPFAVCMHLTESLHQLTDIRSMHQPSTTIQIQLLGFPQT